MTEPVQMAQVEEVLRGLDESWSADDESYRVGAVLLASAVLGPDVLAIAGLTSYDAEWVALVGARLTKSRVWEDGQVHSNWFDPEEGAIAFLLDVNVGLGLMERCDD